jgi:hypothetical protein
MLNTPVGFFIFNRPDLTEIVFDRIRQAQPKKLFVIADGPRSSEDVEKCQKTRAVINKVDWECEILTNFSEENLGSTMRLSSGVDWIFSESEEAIILEDDCLPTSSFFNFCQTLLSYYRHDERVMHISGNNFQLGQSRTTYSYYFSKYNHIWGWASWRRAWQHFDLYMKTWAAFKQDIIHAACIDPYERKYWTTIFDRCLPLDNLNWDYAWLYTCWSQGGLSILPNSNLVSNLGFRSDATRTSDVNNPVANLPTADIWEITHPPIIIRNQIADAYTFDTHYGGYAMKQADRLSVRCIQKLRAIGNSIKKSLR